MKLLFCFEATCEVVDALLDECCCRMPPPPPTICRKADKNLYCCCCCCCCCLSLSSCDCSYNIRNRRRKFLSPSSTSSRYDCSRNSRMARAVCSARCNSCRENPKFCSIMYRSNGCCFNSSRCDTRSGLRIASNSRTDISVFDTGYHPMVIGTPEETAGLHPTITGCSLMTTDPNRTAFVFLLGLCGLCRDVEDLGFALSDKDFDESATTTGSVRGKCIDIYMLVV